MLYIKVENGQTVDHPVFPINLMDVFGEIPANYEPFNRVASPEVGHFEKLEYPPTYAKVDGVWSDVWSVRQMTDEEKAQVIAEATAFVTERVNNLIADLTPDLTENPTEEGRIKIAEFIEKIKALDLVDPFNIVWPEFPSYVNGHFVFLSLTDKGSAPNVIG
jgi:hypothetical protein